MSVSAKNQSDQDLRAPMIAGAQILNWENIPFERIGNGIERQMIVGEKLMICRLRFAHSQSRRNTTIRTNK
jgi:hypothetical protein